MSRKTTDHFLLLLQPIFAGSFQMLLVIWLSKLAFMAHNRKCILHAAVIMPDHVHLILTPSADKDGAFCIPQIMHAIKSESAHRINKALGGTAGYGRVNRLIMYVAAMKASLANDVRARKSRQGRFGKEFTRISVALERARTHTPDCIAARASRPRPQVHIRSLAVADCSAMLFSNIHESHRPRPC
jgi:REP element-mobilizing transposase RayT